MMRVTRNMPIRLRMLRDERIEPVLHETRTIVTSEGRRRNAGGNSDGSDENRGEARSFHDSPHS
jgi:hypothetical protein